MMGFGGMFVFDEFDCMVDIVKFFFEFIVEEFCGKCIFCCIGIIRLLEILIKIIEGNGIL